jgi:Uma2 family endonuclease
MNALILKFTPQTQFSDDELFEFCAANEGLRIERDNKGQLIIMSPSGSLNSNLHFRIYSVLVHWNDAHPDLGYIFDASGGFRLPDNSVLAPDAAFIFKSRWEQLTVEQQRKFAPVTPDFIIEVRSESDSLAQLKMKMETWIKNGCRLAWLIDPLERKAYAYTTDSVENYSFKDTLNGGPILADLQLDLSILAK